MKDGVLVPDSFVVDLVMQNLDGKAKVLLDGFRSLEQGTVGPATDRHGQTGGPRRRNIEAIGKSTSACPQWARVPPLWNPPKVDGREETGEELCTDWTIPMLRFCAVWNNTMNSTRP